MEYIDNILDCEQIPSTQYDNVAKLQVIMGVELVQVELLTNQIRNLLRDNKDVEFDTKSISEALGVTISRANSSVQVIRKSVVSGFNMTTRHDGNKNYYKFSESIEEERSLDVTGALFSFNIEQAVNRQRIISTEML